MTGKFLAILALLSVAALSQAAVIPFDEAANHIGEEATVSGEVSRVSTIPSGMTFVNFGKRGEAKTFTAVARPGVADPETLKGYEGKVVEVTGKIELYRNSPQIVIGSAGDIRISGAVPAEGKPSQGKQETPNPAYEISSFEVPLERREARAAGKTPEGDYPENAIVAVAHPPGFKPKEGQRLLIVVTDFVSGPDYAKLLKPYLKAAADEGLFVLSASGPVIDSKLSPEWYPVMIRAALRHLAADYPNIREWPVYLAGKSDGAALAGMAACALTKDGLKVKGCYLTSLRSAEFEKAIDTFRPTRADIRKLKIFVAHGTDDEYVSRKTSLEQTELIREAGLDHVRHEMNGGWGWPEPESLAKAFKWFGETAAE